jgi:hypothetical protein
LTVTPAANSLAATFIRARGEEILDREEESSTIAAGFGRERETRIPRGERVVSEMLAR